MDAIRIKNLRSLQDTEYVDINSLNILVGQNSSGKSTFLRCFPLLKQSVETDSIGSILWYGNLVDFGSFKEALYRQADSSNISFGFQLLIDFTNKDSFFYYRFNKEFQQRVARDSIPTKTELTVEKVNTQEHSYLREISVSVFDSIFNIQLDSQSRLTSLSINSRDITDFFKEYQFIHRGGGLLPSVSVRSRRLDSSDDLIDSTVFDQLFAEVKSITRSRTPELIQKIIRRLQLSDREQLLQQIQNMSPPTQSWEKAVSGWTLDSPQFNTIVDLLFAGYFELIYMIIQSQIGSIAQNVYYIAPLRASAERYYRVQGLAVREVDAQGRNLVMFVQNLPSDLRKKLNNWLTENFDFELRSDSEGGHLSLKIKLAGSSIFENLADMGFGYSQMIPILIQLWMIGTGRSTRSTFRGRRLPYIFAIEQPELHLHPRLQAKLADVFISTIQATKKIGLDLRLIIETHSETMINRFGSRIADGGLDHNSINVIVFEKNNNSQATSIMRSGYDEEGYLTKWPYGFFRPED
jgi:predicted ATPase